MLGAPLGKGALMRMQTAQVRQQRRVDIENPAVPPFDEIRAQNAHESGEADEFDSRRPQARVERRLESRLARETPKVDRLGGDARFARRLEPGRVGPVGQHERDLGREVGPSRRRDQRLHVGAAAGYQDRRSNPPGHNGRRPSVITRGPPVGTSRPIRVGARPASASASRVSVFALLRNEDRHPESAVEGAQHLVLGDPACGR